MSKGRPVARPRVVVVGAGFGGLATVRRLARTPAAITLIDRRNYHLFQPLLYQVATAALSPADIAWPIRSLLRRQANVAVELGEVTGVDLEGRSVVVDGSRPVSYDFLVLATGARHAYFGHDDWEGAAPGIKRIADATEIRKRILLAFERAETASDASECEGLMTFVVVGGGPTGVEMAGAIAELGKMALASDFRRIDTRMARIVLVEAGPRLLPAFPEKLSTKAARALERLGVEVRLGSPVTACDRSGVAVEGGRIAARTVIWAAGVMASPAARWLGAASDRAGRVVVGRDLSIPGHPGVFVIGDTAIASDLDGRPVPGVAPAAKQMGHFVGALIDARIRGEITVEKPFRFRPQGNLATIGRKAAVADFGRIQLSGLPAWLLWAFAHVYFLIGWRNRAVVALNWLWSYLTLQRGARLITGDIPRAQAVSEEAPSAPRAA